MTELELTKAKLGITSNARDNYLTALIDAVWHEWENVNGIRLNDEQKENLDVIDLVADVVVFKYRGSGTALPKLKYQMEGTGLPPNLRLRLNNLYVKYAGLPEV